MDFLDDTSAGEIGFKFREKQLLYDMGILGQARSQKSVSLCRVSESTYFNTYRGEKEWNDEKETECAYLRAVDSSLFFQSLPVHKQKLVDEQLFEKKRDDAGPKGLDRKGHETNREFHIERERVSKPKSYKLRRLLIFFGSGRN